MLLSKETDFSDLLACPACKTRLGQSVDGPPACTSADCRLSGQAFARAGRHLVLVDFDSSVIDRARAVSTNASTLVPRGKGWREILNRVANGTNHISPFFADQIIRHLKEAGTSRDRRPLLLIIGGGAVGAGSETLYESPDVDVVAFDVYASGHVNFVADAHAIPMLDESVDAVWIQAVLEHVTDPPQVVAEIHRVLRDGGLVFADTPFMWPVHERAYDFTRYTPSGHRWLFRSFDVLSAGTSSGPGTALILALRYLVASLTRSTKIAHVVALPFVWVRLLDRLCDDRRSLDAAAGIFLLGRKRKEPISRADLIAFYEEQLALQSRVATFKTLQPSGAAPEF